MSHANLSRRAILAGAASVPALALPAAVAVALPAIIEPAAAAPTAAAVVELPNPDAALIALGEQLKAASSKPAKLNARRLYQACRKAAGHRHDMTQKQRDAAHHRFKAMSKENGYSEAANKWDAASKAENKLASAILKIPSNSRIGDGVHAAATIALNDEYMEDTPEVREFLQEMSARAGFPVPAKIARKLGRAVAAPKAKPDPIFAAIEKFKKADAKFGEALHDQGEREELVIDHRADPLFKKLERRANRAGDATSKAVRELSRTVPTTLAGCVAMALFAEEFDTPYRRALAIKYDDSSPCRDIFMISLREGLEGLAGGKAVQS
jgi:hypothetical protein